MIRRLCDARHEAAHAVIGEVVGLRVRSLRLFGREHGRCTFYPKRMRVLSAAVIWMAGNAAQQHWHRFPTNHFTSDDLRDVQACGFLGQDVALVRELAVLYVRRHARAIERVARELVKRDLTGAEVRRLLKRRRRSR